MGHFASVEIPTKDGPRVVKILNLNCHTGQERWAAFKQFLNDSNRASDPVVNSAITQVESLATECRKQSNYRMYIPGRQSAREAAALRAFANLAASVEDQTGQKFESWIRYIALDPSSLEMLNKAYRTIDEQTGN